VQFAGILRAAAADQKRQTTTPKATGKQSKTCSNQLHQDFDEDGTYEGRRQERSRGTEFDEKSQQEKEEDGQEVLGAQAPLQKKREKFPSHDASSVAPCVAPYCQQRHVTS